MRLLLVEDDPMVGDAVATVLRSEGYAVDWLVDASGAEAAFALAGYELAVLDIMLPDGDGLELLRKFKRDRPQLATLILTALDGLDERVAGLDSGADDYLIKPFEMPELLARLRAVRRRSSAAGDATVTHGNLTYEPALREVRRDGVVVEIPRRELTLFELFLNNRGKVMSREAIHGQMYGWDDDVHSNTVEVYVHNLRRAFGNDLIRTIRGIGYVMDQPG